jgi:hypothetical protein
MRLTFSEDDGRLYDVVAVSLDDDSILWVDEKKTLPNAEAIEAMAVMRQGVEDRFFTHVPHGTYKQGDKYDRAKRVA